MVIMAANNERKGQGNSGRDLSGDTISPHWVGLGILSGKSEVIF